MLERRLEPSPLLRHRVARLVWAAALAGSIGSSSGASGAPHVRIHAASTLEAHASRSGGEVLFQGTLADEGGHPLPGRSLLASVSEGGQHAPVAVEPCPGAATGETTLDRARLGVASLQTDAAGHFCVATRASAETSTAHFDWAGETLVDPASVDVAVDPSRRQVDLHLACEPQADLASEAFVLLARARVLGEGPEAPATALPLVLSSEGGTEIARATTDGEGKARFRVSPTRLLGPPGRGELRVDFEGDATTARARRVVEIERRVDVKLSPGGTGSETLAPADPEDGVTIPIVVTTATGAEISSGIVEAVVDGRPVGAAPVHDGHAELVATFSVEAPAPGGNDRLTDIELRYASDAPWFGRGAGLTLHMPISTRSAWRKAPILLASFAVLLWLALGRRRRPVASPPISPRRPEPIAQPRLEVVRATADPRAGWNGRVVDAHEATAIAGAEIRVERPAFGGIEVLGSCETNEAGRFELRCDAAKRGDRLVVSAPLHASLRRELPPFGQIDVALVSRRRAVIDRLVAWARRRGAPFDGATEPTPQNVVRAALDRANARRLPQGTADWAEAVERVGFSPEPVDAPAEAEVEALAPRGERFGR
jgi:hypothetical protein